MRILLALWALVAFLVPASAQTGLLNHPQAKFFSHEGNLAFLAAGLAQRDSRERARALLTSTVIVTSLKYLTHERRPDGTTSDSFPSGHASAAFTIAGLAASKAHTKTEAALWYLGAALISDSRVSLKRHYPHDVLVGAAIGLLVARTPTLRLRF
ncbi:phosphatase PAP2 family protein [Armatimonas sp.]|uniref:phosphatase PAP2 family protein n=1 Tax=Armatimonas sp. TaxID=1872638 RepID=UPI00286BBC7B|nr:phosphatase PAP2 family protein [Armatimonas sp.]